MVARVSVVRTTPSLQTTPIVVVNSERPFLVILGFPTCRVSSCFYVRSDFPRNGKIGVRSVSDGLKTFSAIEKWRSDDGAMPRPILCCQTVASAFVND